MANLQKVHIFPSMTSYNLNQTSVGANDLAFVPANSGASFMTTRGALASNACVDLDYLITNGTKLWGQAITTTTFTGNVPTYASTGYLTLSQTWRNFDYICFVGQSHSDRGNCLCTAVISLKEILNRQHIYTTYITASANAGLRDNLMNIMFSVTNSSQLCCQFTPDATRGATDLDGSKVYVYMYNYWLYSIYGINTVQGV